MTDRNYTDFQTPVMIARTSSPYELARPCRFSPPSQRKGLEWTLSHPQLAAGGREQPGLKTEGHRGVRCEARSFACAGGVSISFEPSQSRDNRKYNIGPEAKEE